MTKPRNKRRKAAAQRDDKLQTNSSASPRVSSSNVSVVSSITESDLLAFQLSHFGDDTKPDTWFVEEQIVLDYDPTHDHAGYEDDELGYYEDGVKRTLTDEQIEMFRHSEMEQLLRDGLLAQDEYDNREEADISKSNNIDASVMSPASSIEEELANAIPPKVSISPVTKTVRQPSPSTQSDTSQNSAATRRRREAEVPYDQRNKRKWEGYVEDMDPEHGSRTHRRIVRELDEQRIENVELEY